MRVKLIPTQTGYRLESHDDDRRNNSPLATQDFVGSPLLLGQSVLKKQIDDIIIAGGDAYRKNHGAQAYTGNSGGS